MCSIIIIFLLLEALTVHFMIHTSVNYWIIGT